MNAYCIDVLYLLEYFCEMFKYTKTMDNKVNKDNSSNAKYRDVHEQDRESGNKKDKEDFQEQEYKDEKSAYEALESDNKNQEDIEYDENIDNRKKGYKKGIFRGLIKKLENFLKFIAYKTKIQSLLDYIKKLGIIISLQMLLDNIAKNLVQKKSTEKLRDVRKIKKAKRTKGAGKDNSTESEKELESKDKEKLSSENEKETHKDKEKERDKAIEEQKSKEKSTSEEKHQVLSPSMSQELDSFNKSHERNSVAINSGTNITPQANQYIPEQYREASKANDMTKGMFMTPGSSSSGSLFSVAGVILDVAKDIGVGISNAVQQANSMMQSSASQNNQQQNNGQLYVYSIPIQAPRVGEDGSISPGTKINILADEKGSILDISAAKDLDMGARGQDFRSQVKGEKSLDKSYINNKSGNSGLGF